MSPRASRARRASRMTQDRAPSSPPRAAPSRVRDRRSALTMAKLDKPNSFRNGPNERGRFGIYGGRFVAETLMPLILSLEKAYKAAKADPSLPGRARPSPQALCRPAEPALFRRAADREARRGEDLFQARGAQPHRRAQDQQRARPDPARPPHGQEAHHRRDRRRPARRRHRDRLRPLRPAMRGLHGRGRRRAAEAQRLPHEDARRRGRAGPGRARARSRTR